VYWHNVTSVIYQLGRENISFSVIPNKEMFYIFNDFAKFKPELKQGIQE
jgi:hypothetical protein